MGTIVHSFWFESSIAIMVLANAAFIGIQTQHISQLALDGKTISAETSTFFYLVGLLFCVLYIIELSLRWLALGKYVCSFDDRHWIAFDCVVVLVSIVEVLVETAAWESKNQTARWFGVLRAFRNFRIVRILRALKVYPFFREFRMMVRSIAGSGKSLIFALVAFCLFFYTFSIALVSGVSSYYVNECNMSKTVCSNVEDLESRFGSLQKAMLTLYLSMSGGMDWGDALEVLEPLPWLYSAAFVMFTSFAIFAMANIVTGLFVESAITAASLDRESVIQDENKKTQEYLNLMIDLFREMDSDQSGHISLQDFDDKLNDERALAYFRSINLDPSEVRHLFELLDSDESSNIDMEEFIIGCKKLSGGSRAFDLAILQIEVQWLMDCFHGFADFMEVHVHGELEGISSKIDSFQQDFAKKTSSLSSN